MSTNATKLSLMILFGVVTGMLTACQKKTVVPGLPVGVYFNILHNDNPISSDTISKIRYFWYQNGKKKYYSPYGDNYVLDDKRNGAEFVTYLDAATNKQDSFYLFKIVVWNVKSGNVSDTYYIEYPDNTTDTIELIYKISRERKDQDLSGVTINGKTGIIDATIQSKQPSLQYVYKRER